MPKELLSIIKNNQLSDDERMIQLEAALGEGASWYEEDTKTHEMAIHVFVKKANEILFEWLYQRYLKQDKSLLEHQDGKKNTLLHFALENDNENIALRLLENGIGFQMLDSQGYHPIHKAANQGYLKVVEFLYQQGADINQISSNDWGYTPLLIACHNKYTKLALKLIQWGADINQCCKWAGMYPLHIVAQKGLVKVLRALHERNVNVNQLTKCTDKVVMGSISSALSIACNNKQQGIALKLIKFEADVNMPQLKIDYGVTYPEKYPLHIAVENKLSKVVDALLAKGVSIDKETSDEQTALHLALKHKNSEIAFKLINHNAFIDDRAIVLAAQHNLAELLKLLLDKKDQSNQLLYDVSTKALIKACQQGAEDTAEILFAYGAQINKPNKEGLTALHAAAFKGHMGILQKLFNRKAYLTWYTTVPCRRIKKQSEIITPLSIAIETLDENVLNYLLNQETTILQTFQTLGWNVPPFFQDALTRKYYCYDKSANRKKEDDYGRSLVKRQMLPIHLLPFAHFPVEKQVGKITRFYETVKEFTIILKILIKHGMDINIPTPDKYRKTLLHLLCEIVNYKYGEDNIVLPSEEIEKVIRQGGNPYLKDAAGNTPLVYYYHHYGDYYKPETHLFNFLITSGFKPHKAFYLKNMHINAISNENVKEWHDFILNYVPRDYFKLCQGTDVSKENHGGLLGRKIMVNDLEAYKDIKKYFLAFGVSFEKDEMKEVGAYLNFSKWAITEVAQLATITLSVDEITFYLQILGAYLMAKELVEDKLFVTVGDAVICLMERILIKKELTIDHLKALKRILENAKNLADGFKAKLDNLYLRAYRQLFNRLPSLAFLALDKLLLSSIKPVNDDFTAEQSVMGEQYKNYPLKTYFVQTGYHRLSLLFQGSQATNEQAISTHKKLKRTAPKSEEEDKQPKKRQKLSLRFT